MGKARPAFWSEVHFYQVVGLLIAVLIIVLLVIQRAMIPPHNYRIPDYLLQLIGVALVSGIIFWVCTASSGDLNLSQLGLRLGGGAAIGAGLMLLAWQLAKSVPAQSPPVAVVVPLTEDAAKHAGTLRIATHDPAIERPFLAPSPPTLIIVRFIGDAQEAQFTLEYLAPERRKIVKCVYTVTRWGPKPDSPVVTEEDISS